MSASPFSFLHFESFIWPIIFFFISFGLHYEFLLCVAKLACHWLILCEFQSHSSSYTHYSTQFERCLVGGFSSSAWVISVSFKTMYGPYRTSLIRFRLMQQKVINDSYSWFKFISEIKIFVVIYTGYYNFLSGKNNFDLMLDWKDLHRDIRN